MSTPVRSLAHSALVCLALSGLAGCSDQSRYVMNITSIVPKLFPDTNTVEVDLLGDHERNACQPNQDLITVKVRVEHPGTMGPSLGAYITGYRIDYFYYDPISGALSGPVTFLSSSVANLHAPASEIATGISTVEIQIPAGTFGLKAWAVGATRNNNTGYGAAVAGSIWVERVVARLTVTAEDTTGKKLSAEGSVLMYLNDYGPGPQSNAQCCWQANPFDFWSGATSCIPVP